MFTRSHHHDRSRARLGVAALIAITGIAVIGSSVSAAYGPSRLVRKAAHGVELDIGTFRARHDNIAVGWRETQPGGYFNYVRWSTDGGQTLHKKVAIGQGDYNYGGNAAICGDFVAALHGPSGDLSLALHSLDGSTSDDRDLLAEGVEGSTRSAIVSCPGRRRAAVAWSDETRSPAHAMVAFVPVFEPLSTEIRDLGATDANSGLSLATTGTDAYVVWSDGSRIRVKRFTVANNTTAHVTGHAAVDLPAGGSPTAAAYGSRVVVAYSSGQDVVMQVSDDYGATFASPVIVFDEPDGGPLSAGVLSVDVRGERILIEVNQYDSGLSWPDAVTSRGLLSDDSGATWDVGPVIVGGYQTGALVRTGGSWKVAEAWDQSYNFVGALPNERLRFHVGTP